MESNSHFIDRFYDKIKLKIHFWLIFDDVCIYLNIWAGHGWSFCMTWPWMHCSTFSLIIMCLSLRYGLCPAIDTGLSFIFWLFFFYDSIVWVKRKKKFPPILVRFLRRWWLKKSPESARKYLYESPKSKERTHMNEQEVSLRWVATLLVKSVYMSVASMQKERGKHIIH